VASRANAAEITYIEAGGARTAHTDDDESEKIKWRELFRYRTVLAMMFGFFCPIVIGALVDATGSFVVPLAVIDVIALVGAFNYLVLLGKVEPLKVTVRSQVSPG
jgi:hypothetical protein